MQTAALCVIKDTELIKAFITHKALGWTAHMQTAAALRLEGGTLRLEGRALRPSICRPPSRGRNIPSIAQTAADHAATALHAGRQSRADTRAASGERLGERRAAGQAAVPRTPTAYGSAAHTHGIRQLHAGTHALQPSEALLRPPDLFFVRMREHVCVHSAEWARAEGPGLSGLGLRGQAEWAGDEWARRASVCACIRLSSASHTFLCA